MMFKSIPQHPDLDALIKKSIETYNSLTPEQKREQHRQQRISWVYGNIGSSNPYITREMVEKIVDEY